MGADCAFSVASSFGFIMFIIGMVFIVNVNEDNIKETAEIVLVYLPLLASIIFSFGAIIYAYCYNRNKTTLKNNKVN